MNTQEAVQNIRLYKWFFVLFEPLFWGPIMVQFIEEQGHMTLESLLFMEAIVVAGVSAGEILTGSLADHIGRRKTVFLGQGILVLSFLLFMNANSPLDIWVANIIWGVGFCFVSGAHESIYFESYAMAHHIKSRQNEKFTKAKGDLLFRRTMLVAATSLAVGWMYKLNPLLPMWLSVPPLLVSWLITTRFAEPPRSQEYSWKEHKDTMKAAVTIVRKSGQIRWIVVASALLMNINKTWFFTYNPYFVLVGKNLEEWGLVFCALNVVCGFSNKYAYWLEEKTSGMTVVVLLFLLTAVPLVMMGAHPSVLMIWMIVVNNVVRGVLLPFKESMMHEHMSDDTRATVMSIGSSISAVMQAVIMLVVSLLKEALPLPTVLILMGVFTGVCGLHLCRRYKVLFT